MSCLDVGCGGGDVTRELARRTGSTGLVVGLDMDPEQIEIVRKEAQSQGQDHITYRVANVTEPPDDLGEFDIVYSRFLLCHLPARKKVFAWMKTKLRPGGIIAIEELDLSGHFCYPPSEEFDQYVSWTAASIERRGGDPDLGRKLPSLFTAEGLRIRGLEVLQSADIAGGAKLLNALSMENYAASVVADGIASADQVELVTKVLYEAVDDPNVFASVTRRIQTWGQIL